MSDLRVVHIRRCSNCVFFDSHLNSDRSYQRYWSPGCGLVKKHFKDNQHTEIPPSWCPLPVTVQLDPQVNKSD